MEWKAEVLRNNTDKTVDENTLLIRGLTGFKKIEKILLFQAKCFGYSKAYAKFVEILIQKHGLSSGIGI